MQATLKLSLDRFAEMLRTHHEAIKNSNKNDRSVVRDPYKFVELFRDFWTQLKADAFLSGEVERLSDEHLQKQAAHQQRRGTAGSIPFIDITRETGCVFLRQTAGEYDDQEANDFRTVCREWSADPSLSDEDRKWAADQANATTERRPLEEAVFAACCNSKVFPYRFESMLAALDWLVAVDADRPKTETSPAAPSSGANPVDDARHSIDFASVDGELTDEDKAIALAVKDHGLSIADISDKLAVNRKTPYRWPKFMRIYKALQAGRVGALPPRGSKDRDGNLEAEDDSE